jgi:uncharacterized C2H2 Zn-finger protein
MYVIKNMSGKMKIKILTLNGKKFIKCPNCEVLIPLKKFKRHYNSRECREYQELRDLTKETTKQVVRDLNNMVE